MKMLSCLFLLPLIGCSTLADQGLREVIRTVEYSEPDANGDQYVISETVDKFRLHDLVIAAPWKGRAGTEHSITYSHTADGVWSITFGGTNSLEGGNLVEAIAVVEKALVSGAIEKLKGGL